eukprot:NODE_578_length_6506_cov_0.092711.p2 type:complete len:413 gc:universal NODE_578_length_6506_cov_0.092711:4709-5947(+)
MDILGALVFLFATFRFIFPAIMLKNRKYPYFYHRRPILVTSICISQGALLVCLAPPHTFGKPWNSVDGLDLNYCLALRIIGILNLFTFAVCMSVRSTLVICSNVKSVLMNEDSYKLSVLGLNVTIRKFSRFFDEKFIALYGVLYFLTLLNVFYWSQDANAAPLKYSANIPFCALFQDNSRESMFVLTIICTSVEILLIIMLRSVSDNFHISRESICCIISTFVFGIATAASDSYVSSDRRLTVYNWLVFGTGQAIEAFIMYLPVFSFYYSHYRRNKNESSTVIEVILSNTQDFNSFLKYLTREWASENLLFLKAILDLKMATDCEDISKRSELIADKFIRDGSYYQINLPANIKTDCIQKINNGDYEHAFVGSYFHVKELLECDSLPRFIFERQPESYQSMNTLKSKDTVRT